MICPKCKAAGDASALARDPGERDDIRELLLQNAVGMHRLCPGCDCQHRVTERTADGQNNR
jgi:hypothetical protein